LFHYLNSRKKQTLVHIYLNEDKTATLIEQKLSDSPSIRWLRLRTRWEHFPPLTSVTNGLIEIDFCVALGHTPYTSYLLHGF